MWNVIGRVGVRTGSPFFISIERLRLKGDRHLRTDLEGLTQLDKRIPEWLEIKCRVMGVRYITAPLGLRWRYLCVRLPLRSPFRRISGRCRFARSRRSFRHRWIGRRRRIGLSMRYGTGGCIAVLRWRYDVGIWDEVVLEILFPIVVIPERSMGETVINVGG